MNVSVSTASDTPVDLDAIMRDAGRGSTSSVAWDPSGPWGHFYSLPPIGEVELEELCAICQARLELLMSIHRLIARSPESVGKCIVDQAQNILISSFPALLKDSPMNDLISHYTLRLAMSETVEQREWFLRAEEFLFACRLYMVGLSGLQTVLSQTGKMDILREAITSQSHPQLFHFIKTSSCSVEVAGPSVTQFFKVHLLDVPPELIARRAVVMLKGFGYVTGDDVFTMAKSQFAMYLSKAQEVAGRQVKRIMHEDDRIAMLIRAIDPERVLTTTLISSKNRFGLRGDGAGGTGSDVPKVNLSNVFGLAKTSFPPCMRAAVEFMRPSQSDAGASSAGQGMHLKNTGRSMLTPFLKRCGMSLDESLAWWKSELCRTARIDAGKFEKTYAYNIRWVYGKAGRMKEDQGHSCATIIAYPPMAKDQMHGCPFKNYDEHRLSALLTRWLAQSLAGRQTSASASGSGSASGAGFTDAVRDVVNRAKNKEFQLACVEWFKLMHPGHSGDGVGNHPMQYYQESALFHHAPKSELKASVKGEPAVAGRTHGSGSEIVRE